MCSCVGKKKNPNKQTKQNKTKQNKTKQNKTKQKQQLKDPIMFFFPIKTKKHLGGLDHEFEHHLSHWWWVFEFRARLFF